MSGPDLSSTSQTSSQPIDTTSSALSPITTPQQPTTSPSTIPDSLAKSGIVKPTYDTSLPKTLNPSKPLLEKGTVIGEYMKSIGDTLNAFSQLLRENTLQDARSKIAANLSFALDSINLQQALTIFDSSFTDLDSLNASWSQTVDNTQAKVSSENGNLSQEQSWINSIISKAEEVNTKYQTYLDTGSNAAQTAYNNALSAYKSLAHSYNSYVNTRNTGIASANRQLDIWNDAVPLINQQLSTINAARAFVGLDPVEPSEYKEIPLKTSMSSVSTNPTVPIELTLNQRDPKEFLSSPVDVPSSVGVDITATRAAFIESFSRFDTVFKELNKNLDAAFDKAQAFILYMRGKPGELESYIKQHTLPATETTKGTTSVSSGFGETQALSNMSPQQMSSPKFEKGSAEKLLSASQKNAQDLLPPLAFGAAKFYSSKLSEKNSTQAASNVLAQFGDKGLLLAQTPLSVGAVFASEKLENILQSLSSNEIDTGIQALTQTSGNVDTSAQEKLTAAAKLNVIINVLNSVGEDLNIPNLPELLLRALPELGEVASAFGQDAVINLTQPLDQDLLIAMMGQLHPNLVDALKAALQQPMIMPETSIVNAILKNMSTSIENEAEIRKDLEEAIRKLPSLSISSYQNLPYTPEALNREAIAASVTANSSLQNTINRALEEPFANLFDLHKRIQNRLAGHPIPTADKLLLASQATVEVGKQLYPLADPQATPMSSDLLAKAIDQHITHVLKPLVGDKPPVQELSNAIVAALLDPKIPAQEREENPVSIINQIRDQIDILSNDIKLESKEPLLAAIQDFRRELTESYKVTEKANDPGTAILASVLSGIMYSSDNLPKVKGANVAVPSGGISAA